MNLTYITGTVQYNTVLYGTVVENMIIPYIIMENHNKSHKTEHVLYRTVREIYLTD
jgi:hypothetical protein